MIRAAGTLAAASALALVIGCSSASSASSDEPLSDTSTQAIIAGKPSTRGSVVLLVSPHGRCTATLVAPNVILTAVHCVGRRTETVSADGAEQTVTYPVYTPAYLEIYTGNDAPERLSAGSGAAAKGAKIVAPSVLAYPDIALVVLDRKLDAPAAALRLDGLVARGETLVVAGFGTTETDVYSTVLLERGATVTDVGPTRSEVGPIRFGEFTMGEATCYGDSGGPVLAASGAVVGVVSRGGNAGMHGMNGARDCIGPSHVSIVPSLAMIKDVIVDTIRQAGAEPVLEREATLASTKLPTAADAPDGLEGGASSAEEAADRDASGCSVSSSSPAQHVDDTTMAAAILASASVILASVRRRVRRRLRR